MLKHPSSPQIQFLGLHSPVMSSGTDMTAAQFTEKQLYIVMLPPPCFSEVIGVYGIIRTSLLSPNLAS